MKSLLLFFFYYYVDWLVAVSTETVHELNTWMTKMNDCCFQNTKKETAVLQWMSYFTAACSFIDYPKNTTGRSHVMRREEYPTSAGVSSSSERTIPVPVVTATKKKNKKKHTYTMRSTVWLDEGRGDRWQTGGAELKLMPRWFLTDGSLNASSAVTLLLQVYNHVISPLKYRHNTNAIIRLNEHEGTSDGCSRTN